MTTAVSPDNRIQGRERDELAELLRRRVDGEVRFDAYSRILYSTDASIYRMDPVGVVIPRSVDDVQAVVEIARDNGVPVLPRGGGTSLAGQTVNHAIVVDFSKYLNQLVEVNPEESWARVRILASCWTNSTANWLPTACSTPRTPPRQTGPVSAAALATTPAALTRSSTERPWTTSRNCRRSFPMLLGSTLKGWKAASWKPSSVARTWNRTSTGNCAA